MKKPKYNIGDRVIIIKGKSVPGGLTWLDSMDDRVGRVFTIKAIYPHINSVSYELKNDAFYYDERWLTPEIEEKPEEKRSGFKQGDRIFYNGNPATVVYRYEDGGYLIRYDKPDKNLFAWAVEADGKWDSFYRKIGADPKAGKVYQNVIVEKEKEMKPLKDDVPVKSDKKRKRTIVIQISDDGAEARYIVGKKIEKQAQVRRYYKDKPADDLAAIYAVAKLFGGELKSVEETKSNSDKKTPKSEEMFSLFYEALELLKKLTF